MNTDKNSKALQQEDPIYPEAALTEKILSCAFQVHNTLGAGFLEQVYAAALAIELNTSGLRAAREVPYVIEYRGKAVGNYFADLVVEERVLVELKCCGALTQAHFAQTLNYLRAAMIKVALVLNFARPKLEYRRLVG